MLLIYSDGGPDHRTSFWSVQLAHVMQFIALDLDLLIAAHTAPHHNYSNHAERIMSLLNIALQNSALHRQTMSEEYESRLKSLKTITSIRRAAERSDTLQTVLLESTEPPNATIGFIEGKVKASKNKTLAWLDSKDHDEQERLVSYAVNRARKMRSIRQKREDDMNEIYHQRQCDKIQKARSTGTKLRRR